MKRLLWIGGILVAAACIYGLILFGHLPAVQEWFRVEYIPKGQPFYDGAVWGNLFVVPLAVVLGWLWSKTKFWPMRPAEHLIKGLHTKIDNHIASQKEHNKKQEAHNKWVAKHVAEQHKTITGKDASPHPHFKDIGKDIEFKQLPN
jgi:hypothetical protein